MARVSGACFGLFAFAVTIFAGLWVGNPAATTLSRGLWAMVAFFLLGSVLGYVGQRVVDEYAIRRRQELFGDPVSEGPAVPSAPAKDPAAEKATAGAGGA